MVSTTDQGPTRTPADIRAGIFRFALEALANFVLPFAIYSYVSPRLGPAPALMASSGPPILWSIAGFIRERKLDAISIIVLAGIALSLMAFAGGGGVKFLQLRETLVGGLISLIFLGSAAIGRPLIFYMARAGAKRRGHPEVFEGVSHDPQFRRATLLMTLGWGFSLLAVCALSCTLVFALTIKQFLLINGPINTAVILTLTGVTFWYVPRALRQAMARQMGGSEAL